MNRWLNEWMNACINTMKPVTVDIPYSGHLSAKDTLLENGLIDGKTSIKPVFSEEL